MSETIDKDIAEEKFTLPVSSEESIKSLAIVLAVYKSAVTNTSIELDEFIKSKQ